MQPNLWHLYEPTPIWLDALMVVTSILTIGLLYVAARRVSLSSAIWLLGISLIWMSVLATLASNHFFQRLDTVPPRFILSIGPPLLLIIGLFSTGQRRHWLNRLPLSVLTLLHTVRVPVELTLYGLYLHQQIPQLMTFDGRNFDILAGLTAPALTYFTFQRRNVSARGLLVWNLVALGLVLAIVVQAVLSAPLPFQQMAFEQPNVAVLKAPYVWLPGVIVPIVLFSHAVAIQRLMNDILRRKSTHGLR